jgi:hypothetical protein
LLSAASEPTNARALVRIAGSAARKAVVSKAVMAAIDKMRGRNAVMETRIAEKLDGRKVMQI